MSQTIRTVNELISAAFYLIGEFSEEEPITGADFQRGFDIINLVIDSFSGTEHYIPLTKSIEFNLTPNKNEYIISNVPGVIADVAANRLAQVNYFNIEYPDNWRWPVQIITKTQVYTNFYNPTISARPRYVLMENSEESTKITLFPTPNTNDKAILHGKFYLDKFEKFQPIRNIPLNYQEFLIYATGKRLINYYPSANWMPQTEQIYRELYDTVVSSNDIDMTSRPSCLLSNRYRNNFDMFPFFSWF